MHPFLYWVTLSEWFYRMLLKFNILKINTNEKIIQECKKHLERILQYDIYYDEDSKEVKTLQMYFKDVERGYIQPDPEIEVLLKRLTKRRL